MKSRPIFASAGCEAKKKISAIASPKELEELTYEKIA